MHSSVVQRKRDSNHEWEEKVHQKKLAEKALQDLDKVL